MTATTSTSLTEAQLAEAAGAYIKAYGRPDPLAAAIAWRQESQLNVATKFLRFEALDLSSLSKSEGSAGDELEITMDEVSATPAINQFQVLLTDEAQFGAMPQIDMLSNLFEKGIVELRNQRDSDILAVSTGATQTSGSVSDPASQDGFFAAVGTYKGLDPVINGPVVAVLGNQAATDLKKSLGTSTAAQLTNSMFGQRPLGSYVGTYAGVEVYESTNVADESTGKSNIITSAGQGGGLGLAWAPDRATNGLEVGFSIDRGQQGEDVAGTYMTFRMIYAAVLTDARGLVEYLTT